MAKGKSKSNGGFKSHVRGKELGRPGDQRDNGFSRHAGAHPRNTVTTVMRGGIRL